MSEIVVNEVSKSIYGVPIINSVSMTLVSGNVYGFQGINGSGKTMLMRLICGLIYPTKGEIVIDGKRLGKEITFPQSVGLLLENPAFLDSYTGFENLEMLASIKNIITREEIHEAITSVGLDPLDKRKYKKFSLGMKQRLGMRRGEWRRFSPLHSTKGSGQDFRQRRAGRLQKSSPAGKIVKSVTRTFAVFFGAKRTLK